MEVEDEEVVDIATHHVQSVISGSHGKDAVIGLALVKAEAADPWE